MTSRLISSASLLAALWLVGCANTPEPAPVVPTLPEAFRHQDGWRPLPSEAWNDPAAWWTVFNDATLNALVAQADTGNLSLAQAQARVRQAEALLQSAGAAGRPTLGASASATRSGGDGAASSSSGSGTRYSAGLNVAWTLDLWGRVARQVEAEQAGVQASVADVAAVRLATRATLVQGYLRLRVYERQKDLLAQAQSAYERSLALTRNQYEAGLAARADVIQADTQLQSLLTRVHDIDLLRLQQEHALAVLAGRPTAGFAVAPVGRGTGPGSLPEIPAVPPALPSTLLARRPDVVAAERRVVAANARIGVAQTAWLPDLTLGASVGGQGARLAGLLSAPNRVWSVGPALAATLFDGGARSAATALAQAQYDEQVAVYRQAVLTGLREVDDALAALQVLQAKAVQQARLVELAQENERVALNRYRAGMVSFLEVSVAQSLVLDSQRAALDVAAERLDASIRLIAALGGGWVREAAPP